jgi:membrane associated rhomboid family serine protease
VFVPLHDVNPLKHIRYQYVTVALIALNFFVFIVFQSGLVLQGDEDPALAFAVVPADLLQHGPLLGGQVAAPLGFPMPERITLLTYMFLHAGWLHIIGNMLFLWVFGDNVEDAMGHVRFIMFYLVCGIAAAIVHAWVMPNSELPLVGASGAVAGVIAAYLILHPRVKVWVLALWRIPLKITAAWALGFWVLLQFLNLFAEPGDNIAWGAHVGGLVAGALLILFMRRRGIPLFDRTPGGA